MKIVKYENSEKKVFINLVFSKEDLKTIKDPYEYFSNLFEDEIKEIGLDLRELIITKDYDHMLQHYTKEDIDCKELFFVVKYEASSNYLNKIGKIEDLFQYMCNHFLIKKFL